MKKITKIGLIVMALFFSIFLFRIVQASQINNNIPLPLSPLNGGTGKTSFGSTSTILFTTSTNNLAWDIDFTHDIITGLTRMRHLDASGYVNFNTFTPSVSSTISPTDGLFFINVATNLNPITMTLPLGADVGRTYWFNDTFGNAAQNNITIVPQGGATINGASSYVINQNWGCVGLQNNLFRWTVISHCPTNMLPGFSSYVTGSIYAAANTSSLIQITPTTTGYVLQSSGTSSVPVYGKIELSSTVSGTLPYANGGTNTSTSWTQGSVMFAGATSFDEDNSRFFYNKTTHRLGIGTSTPQKALDVVGSIQNLYGTNSTVSQVGSANVSGAAGFQIAKVGQTVYLTDLTSSTLSIVDVSKPSAPVQKGSIVLSGQLRGVSVSNGIAYVAAASPGNLLYAVDVSDSANPRLLNSIAVTDPRCVLATGGLVYVCENNGASSKIKIFSFASSSSPLLLGSAAMDQGVAGKIDVKNGKLYAPASSSSTISIFDVSDPTSPVLKSRTAITGGAFQVESSGDVLYAVNTSGRITVMDVSSSTAPTVMASTTVATANGSMFLADRYLYMVGSSVIRIVDVSDPTNPTLVLSPTIFSQGVNLWVDGRLAYVVFSTTPNSLTIYDLGGVESNSFVGGTARFGKLSVLQDAWIMGFLDVETGLKVGKQGIMTSGGLTVQGSSNLSGTLNLGRLPVGSGTTTITSGMQVELIGVNTTGGAATIVLPAANSVGTTSSARIYTVKDEGGNAATSTITISRTGSDTIDGLTTKVINVAFGSFDFYSDGVSKWFIK